MEATLESILQLFQTVFQFIENGINAAAIAVSVIAASIPFMFQLIALLPGIIGTSILICLLIKIAAALVKTLSGTFNGGGG